MLSPMGEAKRDGTPVLARLRDDLHRVRADLIILEGLWVVVRSHGDRSEWCLAGPFGYGGLPDEWFVGWQSLPAST